MDRSQIFVWVVSFCFSFAPVWGFSSEMDDFPMTEQELALSEMEKALTLAFNSLSEEVQDELTFKRFVIDIIDHALTVNEVLAFDTSNTLHRIGVVLPAWLVIGGTWHAQRGLISNIKSITPDKRSSYKNAFKNNRDLVKNLLNKQSTLSAAQQNLVHLQKQVAKEAIKKASEKPIPTKEIQPVSEKPAVAEETKPVSEKPAVAEETKPAPEKPAVAEETKPVSEKPAVAEETKPVSEKPAVAEETKPAPEKPAVAEETKPVSEKPAVAEETKPVSEKPAVAEETKPAPEKPAVAEETKPVSEKPAVAEETKPVSEKPAVAEETQKKTRAKSASRTSSGQSIKPGLAARITNQQRMVSQLQEEIDQLRGKVTKNIGLKMKNSVYRVGRLVRLVGVTGIVLAGVPVYFYAVGGTVMVMFDLPSDMEALRNQWTQDIEQIMEMAIEETSL